MPQELHVVRCYACKTFQVQIVKKLPKWQCKLCNEKQSVLKVYARGSGKDCRQYVQDLNMQQGSLTSMEHTSENNAPVFEHVTCPLSSEAQVVKKSKWNEYLEEKESRDSGSIHFSGCSENFKLKPDLMLQKVLSRAEQYKVSSWIESKNENETELNGDNAPTVHCDSQQSIAYFHSSKKQKLQQHDNCQDRVSANYAKDLPPSIFNPSLPFMSKKSSNAENQSKSDRRLGCFQEHTENSAPLYDDKAINRSNQCRENLHKLSEERGNKRSKWSQFTNPSKKNSSLTSSNIKSVFSKKLAENYTETRTPYVDDSTVKDMSTCSEPLKVTFSVKKYPQIKPFDVSECLNGIQNKTRESCQTLLETKSPFWTTDDNNLDNVLDF